jgi:hypothetical protein
METRIYDVKSAELSGTRIDVSKRCAKENI